MLQFLFLFKHWVENNEIKYIELGDKINQSKSIKLYPYIVTQLI